MPRLIETQGFLPACTSCRDLVFVALVLGTSTMAEVAAVLVVLVMVAIMVLLMGESAGTVVWTMLGSVNKAAAAETEMVKVLVPVVTLISPQVVLFCRAIMFRGGTPS